MRNYLFGLGQALANLWTALVGKSAEAKCMRESPGFKAQEDSDRYIGPHLKRAADACNRLGHGFFFITRAEEKHFTHTHYDDVAGLQVVEVEVDPPRESPVEWSIK